MNTRTARKQYLEAGERRRAQRRTGDGDWLQSGGSWFFRMWDTAPGARAERRLQPGRRETDNPTAHMRVALKAMMAVRPVEATAVLEELGFRREADPITSYYTDRANSGQSPLEARP